MGGKKQSYASDLAALIQGFEAEGTTGAIETFLADNSSLPGPRGNLELADAFADAVGELAAEDGDTAWALVDKLSKSRACDAPTNDPGEFVAFCTAVAAGQVGAVQHDAYAADAMQLLRYAARDARWRLREAAAMGLQRLLAADFAGIADSLSLWARSDDPLELRAVVAAVAEPALLKEPERARTALDLHRAVLGRMREIERGSEAYKTLVQGLSYSLSVVVAAMPEEGFALMHDLIADGCGDPDLRRIVNENLKKQRLRKPYPERVEAVQALLIG